MNQMIQSLENRVFLSVTSATLVTDVAAVTSAATQTKAAFASLYAAEESLYKTVAFDVKSTQIKSQKTANAKLNAEVVKANAIAKAKIVAAESILIADAKAESVVGAASGKAVLAHPTKTSLEKAVTKAVTKLETVVPAKEAALSTLVTNGLAVIDAAYSEVAIEDPSAADYITAGEGYAATAASAFTTSAATIETAVAQLTTDLAGA